MAEHHRIHPGQVQSQGGGIVRKGAGGPGIQQQDVVSGFDVQAQAMFVGTARCAGGVLDECDDPHGSSLLWVQYTTKGDTAQAVPPKEIAVVSDQPTTVTEVMWGLAPSYQ